MYAPRKNVQKKDFKAERNGEEGRGEIYEAMTCNRLETWSMSQQDRNILHVRSRTKAFDSDELVDALMRAWLLDISIRCLMGLCRLRLLIGLMCVALVLSGGLNLLYQLWLWRCGVRRIGHIDTYLLRLHLIRVRGMLRRMVHRLLRLLELALVVNHVTRHHRHHGHVDHRRGNRRNAGHVHVHRKHHRRWWGRHTCCGRGRGIVRRDRRLLHLCDRWLMAGPVNRRRLPIVRRCNRRDLGGCRRGNW